MALLPSGMGWSAEENYMKQYAGKIAEILAITGLTPLPVAESDAEVLDNGIFCASGGSTTLYRFYMAATEPGCIGGIVNSTLHAFSTNNSAHLRIVRMQSTNGGTTWTKASGHNQAIDGSSGISGVYTKYVAFSGITTIENNFAYASSASALRAMITVNTTSISKINDGYTTVAFVKYKTYSDVVSSTPFLISSIDDYTFFSGGHNETFTALYHGKRFYFSFSRDTDNAVPYGILTLDYTGNDYPVMSPALLFNYVANSVALTVTASGDPWGNTPSEPGGGDGEPDTGDDVPFATPPSSSAVASGFITLFTPDLATLNAVAAYMWGSSFDITQIKKIFANPIDAILGLHIVPCAISPAGNKEIKVAGFGTGQYSGYTTNQYVTVSCGSVTIPKKWGSYLDYSPYTKTQIWLPFIGFREINIDDIQGKTISLQYIIDILSGACVAEVLVPCDDGTTSVLYSFTGSCAAEIPITAADMRGAISAALSIAGGAVAAAATVASGGATAPMAAGVIASTAVNSMALKPTIQRSGTASGAAGYLAQRIPYIVREQPNIALPAEQNKLTGYPSFVTVSLNTLSGYNEIAHIHLENVPGTDAELSEIENLLHSGVIF